MKIKQLLNDWLLVRLEPRKKTTPGGIIRTTEQPVWVGLVLMAGPGRQFRDKFVPMEKEIVGQRVAFLSAATDSHLTGLAINAQLNEEERLIRMSDVLFMVDGDVEITKEEPYYGN
jgi:co-chaperonin GroES (HSP10)